MVADAGGRRKAVPMAREPKQSDRDVSAGYLSDECQSAARWMEQSEVAELFDEAARRRFGQCISSACLKPRKRAGGRARDSFAYWKRDFDFSRPPTIVSWCGSRSAHAISQALGRRQPAFRSVPL